MSAPVDAADRLPWRHSLAAKFIFLIAAVTILLFVSISSFMYYNQRDIEFSRLKVKSQTLASLVASISPDRIFSYDYLTLYQYVKGLNSFPDVQYAIILNEDREPVTGYLDRSKKTVSDAISALGGADILQVAGYIDGLPESEAFTAAIRFSQKDLGTVRIGISRRSAENEIHKTFQFMIAIILAGIAFLVLSVYAVFYRYIVGPIRQLMHAAAGVAQGDLNIVIPIRGNDELGQLSRLFNAMVSNLRVSDDARECALNDLRELNCTLEQRVNERTHAIESANRELERLALYDPLTALPNRTLLYDCIAQLLRTCEQTDGSFSVLIMDLDRFKEINDALGHHVGDQMLIRLGQRLVASLHPTDVVSRLGGDEFAVLLPNTCEKNAVVVAQKILQILDTPLELEGLHCSIDASIGIAVYPAHGPDIATLLKYADMAMYEAKLSKSGYAVYQENSGKQQLQSFLLMADLRVALENGDLSLFYQPIVDVKSGRWHTVEALARWIHQEKGFIPPDQFIPLIEQTGLIRPFTAWAIDTALAQWARWRADGIELGVSVNLSMQNLHDRQFPDLVEALLGKWSAVSGALKLEITEGVVMHDPVRVLETLQNFERLGVALSIDDFGTGYSSLSYLRRLPVKEIKIDRSFVKDMVKNIGDAMIVQSTIDLVHNLELVVVAEGVEDAATLDMLRARGCDFAQGYYFSQPLPAEELPVHKKSGQVVLSAGPVHDVFQNNI